MRPIHRIYEESHSGFRKQVPDAEKAVNFIIALRRAGIMAFLDDTAPPGSKRVGLYKNNLVSPIWASDTRKINTDVDALALIVGKRMGVHRVHLEFVGTEANLLASKQRPWDSNLNVLRLLRDILQGDEWRRLGEFQIEVHYNFVPHADGSAMMFDLPESPGDQMQVAQDVACLADTFAAYYLALPKRNQWGDDLGPVHRLIVHQGQNAICDIRGVPQPDYHASELVDLLKHQGRDVQILTRLARFVSNITICYLPNDPMLKGVGGQLAHSSEHHERTATLKAGHPKGFMDQQEIDNIIDEVLVYWSIAGLPGESPLGQDADPLVRGKSVEELRECLSLKINRYVLPVGFASLLVNKHEQIERF
ncbi:hypothetical protein JYT84_00820, partial [bacterium AH-315-M10]|nr:hypothetical protein [bacterium AH-315-M10]